ncbi:MAG: PTS sugar transporter subunit IIA [Opitutaceae bacterium]|nr:PTS sugar transporter subunit IIA [Opitutaceae bacterium]
MYLNLVQIAESFGVSENVVEDWIHHEGLPHTLDRGRLLFDRTQVAEWAATRGLAAKAGFLAPEPLVSAAGGRLEPLLRTGRIWRDVPAAAVPDVFDQIVNALSGTPPPIRQLLVQRMHAKEGVTPAPVGGGFALPHLGTRVALGRDSGTVALLLLREAWALADPPDAIPVTRLFFFIAPSPRAHLDVLGRICRLIADGPLRDLVLRNAPDEEIFHAVAAADEATVSARQQKAKT